MAQKKPEEDKESPKKPCRRHEAFNAACDKCHALHTVMPYKPREKKKFRLPVQNMTNKKGSDLMNPAHQKFWAHFLDPNSETFGNVRKSALEAGFSESFSLQLKSYGPKWFREGFERVEMVKKAEKNLNAALEMEIQDIITDKEGNMLYMKTNVGILKVKIDVSKYITERLAKGKYSQRQEHAVGVFSLADLHGKMGKEDNE